MNYYNLRLIAHNTPGCLGRVLQKSEQDGFSIKNFQAQLNPSQSHYEIVLEVASSTRQLQLITSLAKQEDIRELMPSAGTHTTRLDLLE